MEWRNYSWYPSSCPRAPVQNTESNFGLPHTGKASTSRSECIRGAVRWSWAPVVRREPGSQPCPASESPASTNQEGSSLWYLMGAGIKWNKKPSDCLEEKLCPLENTTVYSRDGKALEQDGQSPHLKVSNTGVEEEMRNPVWPQHWPRAVQKVAQSTWSLTQSKLPNYHKARYNPYFYHKRQTKPKTG